jgi:hypothetical protein
MYLKQFQRVIDRVKARIFGLAPAEQQYPQEKEQLAEAIMAFGRMKHEDDSSHDVLVGVNEMAMRLRETTSAIAGALELLKEQGRAEETSVRGRWRLHLTAQCDRPIRKAAS